MSYTNILVYTKLKPNTDSHSNRERLAKRFLDEGIEYCNIAGFGDVWHDGCLADMSEEFASNVMDLIDNSAKLDGVKNITTMDYL